MVFAINKIDKVGSNPDKIKEQLAGMNILVEDWGGKFQVQNVSAHTGEGIDELLEKILLEAELLELKANPDKYAVGTVVEASLDKGRGYVANIMVQEGTLKVGDMVLAGPHFGKVKAMFNERNQKIEEAGPSTPVLLLGLNGAPQHPERLSRGVVSGFAHDVDQPRYRDGHQNPNNHHNHHQFNQREAVRAMRRNCHDEDLS